MTGARPPAGPDGRRWTRRGLLTAAAAAGGGVLSACTVETGTPAATTPATTTSATSGAAAPVVPPAPTVTVTADPSVPPVAALPEQPTPWTALPVEVLPACKQAAADFLVAAMSFSGSAVGGSARDDATLAERLAPLGLGPEVAQPLVGLLPSSGPAALQVGYSQYGGLDPAEQQASQMVVGEQLLLDAAGAPVRRPFAADVRLALQGDRWVVTAVVPAYPDPPLPPLPAAVEALLADGRVELTGVAAADLRSGVVAEPVAAALLRLAERWRVRVHVFRSGHPVTVFATTRPSAHAVGRAVDVSAIDGIPVVDQGASPWRAFMEAALEAGATNVGGPAEVPPTGATFTDRVHQDHVHLGFPPA